MGENYGNRVQLSTETSMSGSTRLILRLKQQWIPLHQCQHELLSLSLVPSHISVCTRAHVCLYLGSMSGKSQSISLMNQFIDPEMMRSFSTKAPVSFTFPARSLLGTQFSLNQLHSLFLLYLLVDKITTQ